MLGLPDNWREVEGWIDSSRDVPSVGEPVLAKFGVKNPEIPELKEYTGRGNEDFWENFPGHFPVDICRKVERDRLGRYVKKHWERWLLPQRKVAREALARLNGEIEVKFVRELGPLMEKNAKSAVENGRQITDAIVSWIKAGFVAGPFESPPFEIFE